MERNNELLLLDVILGFIKKKAKETSGYFDSHETYKFTTYSSSSFSFNCFPLKRGKGREILVFRVAETQKHEEHVYSSFLSHTPPPPPLVDTMELNFVGTFICINSPSTNREAGRVRGGGPKGTSAKSRFGSDGPLLLLLLPSTLLVHW